MKKKRKKPKFVRQEASYVKALGKKWRRPKGNQSKQRMRRKARGKRPSPGYGSPKKIRGLHPSGFEEILVFSLNDLNDLDPKHHVCRVGSSVGKRKKLEIMKKANENNIKILNPLRGKEESKG